MVIWIRNIFSKLIEGKLNNKVIKNSKGNAYSLRISGKKAINILKQLDILPLQKLDRKWSICHEC